MSDDRDEEKAPATEASAEPAADASPEKKEADAKPAEKDDEKSDEGKKTPSPKIEDKKLEDETPSEEKIDAKNDDDSLPEGMEKLAEGRPADATNPGIKAHDPMRHAPAWRKWAFAIVPAVGLLELAVHEKQIHAVVPTEDWKAARAAVERDLKPDDLVLFAPKWSDPIGRETFGPDIMTMQRSARPDETRFPRAFEVGIRGEHRREMAEWKRTGERQFGAVTVTTFENPAPVVLKDDLVKHFGPEQTTVSRLDPQGFEQQCAFTNGPTVSGGVYYPFGPATPGRKFACNGTFAGVTVIQDLEHDPRLCILAPPMANGILRFRFANVAFGTSIHGHHGLHYDAERHATGEIVSLVFRSGDKSIGKTDHRIGTGWTGFELPTNDLAGQHGELIVDVIGHSQQRQYCWEADAR